MHISFRLLKPLLSPLRRTNRQRIPLSILYVLLARRPSAREEREQKSHRRRLRRRRQGGGVFF